MFPVSKEKESTASNRKVSQGIGTQLAEIHVVKVQTYDTKFTNIFSCLTLNVPQIMYASKNSEPLPKSVSVVDPWNPPFEGLPSKIITLKIRTLHSSSNARVSNFDRRAHGRRCIQAAAIPEAAYCKTWNGLRNGSFRGLTGSESML